MITDGAIGDETPSRRQLLVAVGTGVASGLAGCGDGGTNSGTPTPNDEVDDAFDENTDAPNSSDGGTPTGGGTDEPVVDEGPIDRLALEKEIAAQANELRKANGVGLIDWDQQLHEIARDYSAFMIENEYFDHVGPMGNDWGDRYQAANYRCAVQANGGIRDGGECIARVSYEEPPGREQIARDVAQQLRDDTQGGAMLANYWNVHGVGIALDPQAADTRIFVTQNFC
jgi:uncharacterized protein YkwD